MSKEIQERSIVKVAVICDVLGQANNGTTIAALNLIRTLREKRHEVRGLISAYGDSGIYGI